MWNLKNTTNEYNIKEADSQLERTNWWLLVGRKERQYRGDGRGGTAGGCKDRLKDLLYHMGNIAGIL